MPCRSLPPALQSAVDAINSGDEDAFVAAFSSDGVVNDWGRILTGADGVRSWARSDAIGAQARMTVVAATIRDDTTQIVFDWTSRVFNGRSEAYVTLADGLILEFRIPAK
ncbi:nuclear transport factor 2 family protein [Ochrobactrum oryzae]|nr:nuclear transport factor 2 family protein [Brucella oryzae]